MKIVQERKQTLQRETEYGARGQSLGREKETDSPSSVWAVRSRCQQFHGGTQGAQVPDALAPGTCTVEDSFLRVRGGGGFGMIQVHHIYCALYFLVSITL